MTDPRTVRALLKTGPSDAPAIGTPGRTSLTYEGLRAQVDHTVASLNGMGIGRGDRVAIVLPNGPEMAAAFISIAAGATTAPLNPGYKLKEYDFYLGDLNARALVVEQGSNSEAIDSARALGVEVIELRVPEGAAAGVFELVSQGGPEGDSSTVRASQSGPAEPDDVALVLHTSGTTARPKIVPLLHRNVCASAKNIRTGSWPAGRSSTQPCPDLFFAKNHAAREFGTDLGSLDRTTLNNCACLLLWTVVLST